jgi:hypothetical protein
MKGKIMKTKSASQTGKKPYWKNAILVAITAFALSASAALAADANWIGGIGTWGDQDNWDTHQPPDTSTNAFITMVVRLRSMPMSKWLRLSPSLLA